MSIDVNTLSPSDLDTLISTAKERKVALKKRKPIAEVREKLAKIARKENYGLDELFPASTPAKPATPKAPAKRAKKTVAKGASKVAPKYCNPANPSDTWTGRGRAPRWVEQALADGKSKDDLLI